MGSELLGDNTLFSELSLSRFLNVLSMFLPLGMPDKENISNNSFVSVSRHQNKVVFLTHGDYLCDSGLPHVMKAGERLLGWFIGLVPVQQSVTPSEQRGSGLNSTL